MLASRRVLSLVGACGALAAAATPVVAFAHGGHKGRRVHGQNVQGQDNEANGGGFGRLKPERICREVGVSLIGRPISGLHLGHTRFNDTQVNELLTACKELAAAFASERKEVSAALQTKRTAIEKALIALPENCRPGRHHRHDDHFGSTGPTGPTGPSGATGSTGSSGATGPSSTVCKEARKAFRKAVKEADEAFRNTIAPAAKALDTALMKFDATVQPIIESVQKRRHQHQPTGPTATSGLSGTSGPSGATGPGGTSGSAGTTGFPRPSREPDSGSGQQGGSGSWGGQQQGDDYSGRSGGGR